MLNIFYRYSSGATAITEELVIKVCCIPPQGMHVALGWGHGAMHHRHACSRGSWRSASWSIRATRRFAGSRRTSAATRPPALQRSSTPRPSSPARRNPSTTLPHSALPRLPTLSCVTALLCLMKGTPNHSPGDSVHCFLWRCATPGMSAFLRPPFRPHDHVAAHGQGCRHLTGSRYCRAPCMPPCRCVLTAGMVPLPEAGPVSRGCVCVFVAAALTAAACRPQREIEETAQMLVSNNFTLFFDLESDGNFSRYLHSVVLFSEPPGSTEYVDNMMVGAAPPPHPPSRLRVRSLPRARMSCLHRLPPRTCKAHAAEAHATRMARPHHMHAWRRCMPACAVDTPAHVPRGCCVLRVLAASTGQRRGRDCR